ncbi:MAG: TrmH family RNA methyltransferase [Syntrophomonadaceae bacterium]
MFLLDRVSDPGNMGTIIRTAWALDIEGILLTEDCTDPFSPKVVRASMGGILNVPVYTAVSWESIKQLRAKGYQIVGTAIDAPVNFFDFNYSGANIIVIGSESKGVSNDILVNCDSLIKIPINPVVDSLNAAIACAIIMMEIRKQRKR